jgi:hypothetical protein
MATTIRTWLDDDRRTMHHAPATEVEGMESGPFPGTTYCGLAGVLKLVHHENVDTGKLCEACLAATGTTPSLEGVSSGPV